MNLEKLAEQVISKFERLICEDAVERLFKKSGSLSFHTPKVDGTESYDPVGCWLRAHALGA